MTIEEIQKEIIDEFSFFDDWEQRYEYLIDLGKEMDALPDDEKSDDLVIKGCQSTVWIKPEMKDGNLYFKGDSNAILPKGLVALLLRVYNHQKPKDILNSNTDFIKEIGLQEFLSATRANGLASMVKQFKFYAIAYQSKIDSNT